MIVQRIRRLRFFEFLLLSLVFLSNVMIMSSNELLKKVSVQQVLTMFDMLPDIIFWIKDTQSRVVYANQMFIEHLGLTNFEQV